MDSINVLKELIKKSKEQSLQSKIMLGSYLNDIVKQQSLDDCGVLRLFSSLCANLNKDGFYCSIKDLWDCYCVIKNSNGEPITSWKRAKQNFLMPPQGDCPEVQSYWYEILNQMENSFVWNEEEVMDLVARSKTIPSDIKQQIETISNRYVITPPVKIAHTADWHFVSDDTLEETVESALFFIETVKQQKCDLVVIAGDIVDRKLSHDDTALHFVMKIIKALSEICPVYILSGTKNHDGQTLKLFTFASRGYPVYFCETPATVYLTAKGFEQNPVTQPYLKILGIPPISPIEFKSFMKNLSDFQASGSGTSLFVGHLALAEVCPFDQTAVNVNDLLKLNYNLYLLGHIHDAAQIANNVFYSGSLISRTFGEKKQKGFWIHDLKDNQSIWIPNPAARPVVEVEIKSEEDLKNLSLLDTEKTKVKIKVAADSIKKADIEKHLDVKKVKVEYQVVTVKPPKVDLTQSRSVEEKLSLVANYSKINFAPGIVEKLKFLESSDFETKLSEKYQTVLNFKEE